jgi:hypothetical protein
MCDNQAYFALATSNVLTMWENPIADLRRAA